MSKNEVRAKFYPSKPDDAEGFKQAVAWFGGREMIASLKGMVMYAIYGENMDPRSWMKGNIFPDVEEKVKLKVKEKIKKPIEKQVKIQIQESYKKMGNEFGNLTSVVDNQVDSQVKETAEFINDFEIEVLQKWANRVFDYWEWKYSNFHFWKEYLKNQDFWKKLQGEKKELNEFWFDFIADTGDGQMGVYSVGCACYSDLWLENEAVGAEIKFSMPDVSKAENSTLLPRGYFLFVGGDTAYHTANYATLFERFQTPFRWAFTSVRKFLMQNYRPDLNPIETKFYLGGNQHPVFQKGDLTKTVEEWDGMLCATINEKIYIDTEPPRPLFGIPANHDYYDNIDGFNKQFRRSPFEDSEENMHFSGSKGNFILQIPTFSREQEASYATICLPFGWWMFGIDSENEKLDYRQEIFFQQRIIEHKPTKLILATPEPTTVFGKKSKEDEKTATYLKRITQSLGLEQPFLQDGKFVKIENPNNFEERTAKAPDKFCRLDLSGDVHHYARYWGENTRGFNNGQFAAKNYASVVAGGGGAFFDSTSTLVDNAKDQNEKVLLDENGKKIKGEIPPQKVYPSEVDSINITADRIFDLSNIRKGGYVQHAGAIVAIIIFFFLTQFSNAKTNFDELNALIQNEGLKTLFVLPKNISDFVLTNGYNKIVTGVLLMAVIVCLAVCAYQINQLIKKIKEKSDENNKEQYSLNDNLELFKKSIPFFLAVVIYVAFLLLNYVFELNAQMGLVQNTTYGYLGEFKTEGLSQSLFLMFHLAIGGLLIWLSFEYTNWLNVHFKITRKQGEKTFLQDLEMPDKNGADGYKKFLAKRFRELSYEYIPANVLVILAVVTLVFGTILYGKMELLTFLGDSVITIVIGGGFVLLVYVLGFSTGGGYQTTRGKAAFVFIGLWHAILQLATPFVLYFYTNWFVVILIFVLVTLVNGFSRAPHRAQKLFPDSPEGSIRKWLQELLEYRLAAELMKKNNKWLLAVCWFVYGMFVLCIPFAINYFFPQMLPSFDQTITAVSKFIVSQLPITKTIVWSDWIQFILTCIFLGFIGYRMSRVWFSWYLGVSMLFDGHNNEAGGLARIEDYKHLLRIKVEKEKLTVYVIGLDKAQPNLDENMKLKLVDKFELHHLPIS